MTLAYLLPLTLATGPALATGPVPANQSWLTAPTGSVAAYDASFLHRTAAGNETTSQIAVDGELLWEIVQRDDEGMRCRLALLGAEVAGVSENDTTSVVVAFSRPALVDLDSNGALRGIWLDAEVGLAHEELLRDFYGRLKLPADGVRRALDGPVVVDVARSEGGWSWSSSVGGLFGEAQVAGGWLSTLDTNETITASDGSWRHAITVRLERVADPALETLDAFVRSLVGDGAGQLASELSFDDALDALGTMMLMDMRSRDPRPEQEWERDISRLTRIVAHDAEFARHIVAAFARVPHAERGFGLILPLAALARSGRPEGVAALTELVATNEDEYVRFVAARLLGQCPVVEHAALTGSLDAWADPTLPDMVREPLLESLARLAARERELPELERSVREAVAASDPGCLRHEVLRLLATEAAARELALDDDPEALFSLAFLPGDASAALLVEQARRMAQPLMLCPVGESDQSLERMEREHAERRQGVAGALSLRREPNARRAIRELLAAADTDPAFKQDLLRALEDDEERFLLPNPRRADLRR